jgi:hypothetical protein
LLWSYKGAKGAEVKKALPLLRLMFLENKRKCMSRIHRGISMSGGVRRCRRAELRFINHE